MATLQVALIPMFAPGSYGIDTDARSTGRPEQHAARSVRRTRPLFSRGRGEADATAIRA